MEGRFLNLMYDVIYILAALVAAAIIAYLKKKLGTEKLQQIETELLAKQELAFLSVRFVEQVYKDLHGEEKYNKAAEWLAARIQERGLKITPDEVKGLIEAALRTLKDEFGEAWAKQVK